jgi:hypothetical protein
MKKNPNLVWLGLVLVLLAGVACRLEDISPEYFCEMNGGTWHPATMEEDAWCERAKPNSEVQPENEAEKPAGDTPTEPQVNPPIESTETYASPTPASAQECNATLYVQTQVEVIKETKELYYRECDYKLSASSLHPSEGVWVVRRTNTSVHSSATNLDDSYWYSDLLMPGQGWAAQFRSTYYTDGQTSRQGVDKVAGVYNRPECLYLLNSAEVEAISQPVEWACGP